MGSELQEVLLRGHLNCLGMIFASEAARNCNEFDLDLLSDGTGEMKDTLCCLIHVLNTASMMKNTTSHLSRFSNQSSMLLSGGTRLTTLQLTYAV